MEFTIRHFYNNIHGFMSEAITPIFFFFFFSKLEAITLSQPFFFFCSLMSEAITAIYTIHSFMLEAITTIFILLYLLYLFYLLYCQRRLQQ